MFLSEYCKNIKLLIINQCSDNSGLAQLILRQESLKSIEFKSFYSSIKKFNLLSEVLISNSTLTSICFEENICLNEKCMQILCSGFIKEFKLKFSTFNSIFGFEMVSRLNFFQLEIIDIFLNIQYDISYLLKNLIKRTKGKLKKINWNELYFDANDFISLLEYIQCITTYCPNMEFLSIWYINNNSFLQSFKLLLISCKKLKEIKIQLTSYEDSSYIQEILEIVLEYSEALKVYIYRTEYYNCEFTRKLFKKDDKSLIYYCINLDIENEIYGYI